MTLCYLGLGSNLRSPERQLRQAIHQLHKLPRSVITNISSLYFSEPCGIHAQPTYCNMVLALRTALPPLRLLNYCQRIEQKQRRLRKKNGGARTLDIDLLLYGEQSIQHADLTIPHPQMTNRDFVLVPLLEISPLAHLPTGEPIGFYLKHCEKYLYSPIA